MARDIRLEQLEVRRPCEADWDAMKGDRRRRYCGHCRQHVHDLGAMSPRKAQALLREAKGSLCVRLPMPRRRRIRGWMVVDLLIVLVLMAVAPLGMVAARTGTPTMQAWCADVEAWLASWQSTATGPTPPLMGAVRIAPSPPGSSSCPVKP